MSGLSSLWKEIIRWGSSASSTWDRLEAVSTSPLPAQLFEGQQQSSDKTFMRRL